MHSFSLEHVNDMSTYRRRSFRVTKDLHGSGALGKPSARHTWVELSVSCFAGFPKLRLRTFSCEFWVLR